MQALGASIAPSLYAGQLVYFSGAIGAGKTTLIRGILCGFGFTGMVKSPTYTLVETYELPERTIYHFDLFRLNDPFELELAGVRDYLSGAALCLVEWPERAATILPTPDVRVAISSAPNGRVVEWQSQTSASQSSVMREP